MHRLHFLHTLYSVQCTVYTLQSAHTPQAPPAQCAHPTHPCSTPTETNQCKDIAPPVELCLVSASTVLKPPLLTAVVTAAVGDCTETGGIGEQDEHDEKHKVGKEEGL